MTTRAVLAGALSCAALVAGCGPKTPDYQAFWTTSTTPTTMVTGDPVPIGQYLQDKGVTAEPVAADALPDLQVSIPTPPGWSRIENPKLAPTTQVIAKGDKYPRAILTVLKLTGEFDAADAVKHGFADAELQPNFHRLDASLDDFDGFPSAMIQGSHDLGGERVRTWFRMVIATGSPPADQRYLVQLTIVTLADQAAAQAGDAETIMTGFTVAAK